MNWDHYDLLDPALQKYSSVLRGPGKREVRGQIVAGERVSDYSKRRSRSSILWLRPERMSDWSPHRHGETEMELIRGNGEAEAKEKPGARRQCSMKTFQMRVERAMSAGLV